MKHIKPILFALIFGLTFLQAGSVYAQQQNKVVVVPLGGADVNPRALPIATGLITNNGQVLGGFGIDSATRLSTGFLVINLTKIPAGYPIVIATALGQGRASTVTASSTSGIKLIYTGVADKDGNRRDSGIYVVVYDGGA